MALQQPTSSGFQQVCNVTPDLGEQGQFYGANPRASLLAGPGIWLSPVGGLICGNFCWANQTTGLVTQGYTAGAQIAFVGRHLQAIITAFLGFNTQVIPAGLAVQLYSQGDFWDQFLSGCTPGQTVFADPNTGAAVGLLAAGTAYLGTGYFVAGAAAWAGTGFIVGNTLTVVSTTSGSIAQWQSITLGAIPAGQTATDLNLNQGMYLTAGGGSSWTTSGSPQNVGSPSAPVALIGTGATQFTVSSTTSGTLAVGSNLTAVGLTPGTTILAGAGPYSVTGQQTLFSSGSPGTVNAGANIATPWKVNSYANPGEDAVTSTWG